MRHFVSALFKLAALALSVALLGGWFQNFHQGLDSLTHFRLHFAGLLLLVGVFLTLLRCWKWVAGCVVMIIASLSLTANHLPRWLNSNTSIAGSAHALGIVQFNRRFNNDRPQDAIKILTAFSPDVYILQELTNRNISVFKALKKTHPYTLECISYVVGSVALASKHPFETPSANICSRQKGFLAAQLNINGKIVTVSSVHLRWPWPFQQHQQVTALAKELQQLKPPLIVAGDFNAAPWSHTVDRVAKLTKTNVADGLVFTWAPRFVEFKATVGAFLPIDQVLTSDEFVISKRQVLGDAGSDHFPVLSTVQYK